MLAGASALALALVLVATAPGQGPAPVAAKPAPPLARYVPGQNLIVFAEFAGLDAHAEAWKKTAASRLLTETTLGALLESLATQAIDRAPADAVPAGGAPIPVTRGKLAGADAVAVAKHLARSGFIFATVGDPRKPQPDATILVLRGASRDREARTLFGKLLGALYAPTAKAETTKVPDPRYQGQQGTLVAVRDEQGGDWAWWAEGGDLILSLRGGTSGAGVVIETLAGKRPNAENHPLRAELSTVQDGLLPVGFAFWDPARQPGGPKPGLEAVKRVDARWGFQDDALVSITRIDAPGPRPGLLGLFDQPTFDKATLPPLPAGLPGFAVLSLQPLPAYDRLLSQAEATSPEAAARLKEFAKTVQAKSRMRLREDILAHLGPKLAVFSEPPKAVAPGGGALAALTGALPRLPQVTLLLETDSPAQLNKVLDELMLLANREIKAAFPRPPSGAGSGAGPEFKRATTSPLTYVMSYPPLAALDVRPTVTVGKKYVVLSSSSKSAQQILALETAAVGRWSPPDSVATTALDRLPPNLTVLQWQDPRETITQTLANLPALLQGGGMPGGGLFPGGLATSGGGAAPGGQPPTAGSGGTSDPAAAYRSSGSGGTADPAAAYRSSSSGSPPMDSGGSGSGSGSSSSGGVPPPPGESGVAGGTDSGATGPIRIDPAQLPPADALKSRLFPSTLAVAVEASGIRIVTRGAFPDLAGLLNGFKASSFVRTMAPASGGPPAGGPGAAPPR
jgi:hypothetical protein